MGNGSPDDRPERAEGHIEDVLYARRKALADLMHSPAVGQGDILRAFQQITETAAHVLEIERSSIWRLVDGGGAIECIDLFERTAGRHSAGLRIAATGAPRYFAALLRERAIRADDARTDPRTSEFATGYLEPLGITSMLDAPIFVRGAMVGVVCHEHTGTPRRWTFSEELLAGTFSDFVSLVLETSSWRDAELALRRERDALQDKVDERTRDLRESEVSLRTLLDMSPISIVGTRIADNKVVFANPRAGEMFELPMDQAIGQHSPDFWVDPADRGVLLSGLQRDGRVDDLEVQMKTGTGHVFWVRLSSQRMRFNGDDILIGAMVDITEQKEAQERLRELATHDALTGTFNRRHVEELVRLELERAERYARPVTVAMLDADHFKRVNDTYGHGVGDEVLRAISERCKGTLRTNDVIGRYGGEEFVLLFPETGVDAAAVVAERLREAVAKGPVVVGETSVDITVSIGLACSRGGSLEKLLGQADAALYDAKHGGRNLVRVFGSSVQSSEVA
jgi:diguanylate cyclase (GGDEF)-like protein/PAS domain S-box-containing protein